MNKETVIKDMQGKLEELATAKRAVNDFIIAMQEQAGEITAELEQLKAEQDDKQKAFSLITDKAQAKLLKAELDELKTDIELLEQVASAKHQAHLKELADLAEEFLKVNKAARFLFGTLDKYFLANTSLSSLDENIEYLNDVANNINFSFMRIRQVLINTGIVTVSEQNKNYRGHHLGQRDVVPELVVFKTKIRQIINDYKMAGKLA